MADNDLLRVWHLVLELSDQLAQNQKIADALQSQASLLKVSCPSIFIPQYSPHTTYRTKPFIPEPVLL